MVSCLRGHGPQPGWRLGAKDGGRIWWFGSTFSQAEAVWLHLKRACQNAGCAISERMKCITFKNGGTVTVKSAEQGDINRGDGLDGVICDEAAMYHEEFWKEIVRPMLSDRQGWALFLTTPQGANWFHKVFEDAAFRKDYERWQRPSGDNPIITPAELEEARLDLGPRAFSQEYEAQFLAAGGTEFEAHYFRAANWYDELPANIRWRVLALDPSKGKTDKSDFSAFVMLCLGHDGTLYVDADIERRDVSVIVNDGIRICQEFKPDRFVIEGNAFQELLLPIFRERAIAHGFYPPLMAIENRENKRTRIRGTLTPYLSRDEIKFRRGSRGAKLLVEQLQGFPVSNHDDGPDALEMGVRTVRELFLGIAEAA